MGSALGALAAYQEGLDLRLKLLALGNARAQHDLTINYEKVANALKKLNRVDEALLYDERDLTIS